MDSERSAYERDVERITTTGQYLNLVLNDPWFAWLRELSQFVVIVDEALDQKETEPDAEDLIARARLLASPSEGANGFGGRYYDAMQRDPGVVLAHRDMMRVFEDVAV
jgi:hypothetical protein